MHTINSKELNLIRSQSKLTDQLITIDSPRRHSKGLSQMLYNTMQLKHKFFESRSNTLQSKTGVWYQSASTMARQKSPSHRFPLSERFSSVQADQRRNRLILKLNISNELAQSNGIAFAKSKRIDHFKPKKSSIQFPSPAAYHSDFLLNSKTSALRSRSGTIVTANSKRQTLIKLSTEYLGTQIKGVTIPKQKNPCKVFMHHGQKQSYQPEITECNPGVGKYTIAHQLNDTEISKKFCIGQTLKKFNEFVGSNPGPGAFGLEVNLVPKRVKSANCKGTFSRSKRTYLVDKNPQQYSPAPNSYNLK